PIALLGVREGGAFLWGRRYTGTSTDQLTEMVGRDVQDSLRLRVSKSDGRRLEIERTLQTAKYYWDQRSDAGLRPAIQLYERLVADHDTIARAHAGLAKSYVLQSYYGGQSPAQSYGKAKAAAARALELDAGLADAHATLGLARRDYDRDWDGAEQE